MKKEGFIPEEIVGDLADIFGKILYRVVFCMLVFCFFPGHFLLVDAWLGVFFSVRCLGQWYTSKKNRPLGNTTNTLKYSLGDLPSADQVALVGLIAIGVFDKLTKFVADFFL